MPMDPYSRVFRPDIQANDHAQLPQWLPMGESDQGDQFTQASGTFADLLKKRMAMGKGAVGEGMSGAAGGMQSL